MSDFEKAFNQLSKVGLENHTELWGEPKTERAFFEAGQASKQAEIDGLKTQLNNMEACYIEKKEQVEDQQKRIDEALICVDRATDGYYGFSEEGGDTDNLAKHLEKALRGEHE